MKPVEFHRLTRREVLRASDFYDREAEGLGDLCLSAVGTGPEPSFSCFEFRISCFPKCILELGEKRVLRVRRHQTRISFRLENRSDRTAVR